MIPRGKKNQCTWVQKVYRAQTVYIYIHKVQILRKNLCIYCTLPAEAQGGNAEQNVKNTRQ